MSPGPVAIGGSVQGPYAIGGTVQAHSHGPKIKQPTRSGGWRPDEPFVHGRDGLRITLKHERGVTPAGFLRVPFRFQAPPVDSWGRRWEFGYETYDTIRLGERPRVGGPQLERPSLQTMFLDEELRWMVWNGSLNVQRMLRELKAILKQPAPFRLIIGQPGLWGHVPLVNMVAVFTSIEPEQRGGEVGTEYTSVEFLQWPRERIEKKRRPSIRDSERRHTLKQGDTLYSIALHAYHRKSAWHVIARENGITGVSPNDAGELARWAKRHSRKTLKVPVLATAAGPGLGVLAGGPGISG